MLIDGLDGVRAGLARANAKRLPQIEYPDLPIAGFPPPGHIANRLHHLFRYRIVHCELNLGLGQKVDPVFRAAVKLCMSVLPPVTMHFGDRHPLSADIRHRLPNFVQLERLDDGGDQLHAFIPAFTCLDVSLRHRFRVLLILSAAVSVPAEPWPQINGLRDERAVSCTEMARFAPYPALPECRFK